MPQLVRATDYQRTIFSSCGQYRYTLWREWKPPLTVGWPVRYVMFIGLNPSTADATNDDPTVRRCIRYAQAWGFEALLMMNAFAFRATDPRRMLAQPDPVGPDNDHWLSVGAQQASVLVAAWGARGSHRQRNEAVLRLLRPRPVHCLALTKSGHPKHPLYLPRRLTPQIYQGRDLKVDTAITP